MLQGEHKQQIVSSLTEKKNPFLLLNLNLEYCPWIKRTLLRDKKFFLLQSLVIVKQVTQKSEENQLTNTNPKKDETQGPPRCVQCFKTLPSHGGGVGLIPGQITHGSWPKNQNMNNRSKNCNKFNKDFKNGPHQKKKKKTPSKKDETWKYSVKKVTSSKFS